MLLAHKVALDPNMATAGVFRPCRPAPRGSPGTGRWASGRVYKAGGKPTEVPLQKQLNALKRENFPWMYDVGKAAAQEAIIDLGSAFRGFSDKRTAYPRFKRKEDKPSFCAANEARTFHADGKRIKLPVIGWVRMREAVRFSGPLKRATVCCEAGRFVSLLVETTDVQPRGAARTGRRHRPWRDHAGEAIHRRDDRRSEVTQGSASRGCAGRTRRWRASGAVRANAKMAKAWPARLHRRVAAIRRDATHKLTTRITGTYAVIGIEDLNVRGMVRNRHLARAVSDGGFHEFRRQIEDKARRYGARVPCSPAAGILQARPVLAAASSRRRWPWRKGRSAALTVVSRRGVT